MTFATTGFIKTAMLGGSSFFLLAVTPVASPEVLSRFDKFLKDPRSAQIEVSTSNKIGTDQEQITCGSYNAKNSYGGYIGFKPFVYRSSDGGTLYSDGVAVRSNGSVDSIDELMANEPTSVAELDAISRRGDALIAEVKAAFALC